MASAREVAGEVGREIVVLASRPRAEAGGQRTGEDREVAWARAAARDSPQEERGSQREAEGRRPEA